MSLAFGLDFGTTNSALTVSEEGAVRILDADPSNSSGRTLRSVLYFTKNRHVYAGQEAIDHYLEDDARGRFMQSIKTFLTHRTFDTTAINGRAYQLDDLIALVLRIMKERGEADLGKDVERVVLGRPVIFSEDAETDKLAEDRLRSAAHKAGFKEVAFQFEPIAAALAFEESLAAGEEKRVLIGDFGGGTSDFTIMRLRGKSSVADRKSDILSLRGVYIGGDTFDSRIMWHRLVQYYGVDARFRGGRDQWLEVPKHIFMTLCRWHLIPQLREPRQRESIRQIRARSDNPEALERLEDLIDENYGFKLFQAIEAAKRELSSSAEARIVFREGLTDIDRRIVRTEFEKMIREDLDQIEQCVDATVDDAGLSREDVDAVFITGGSSFVPAIRRIFVERFGADKVKEGEAFTSVAYGLGLTAARL
jgi:hypothetical chaperone protein